MPTIPKLDTKWLILGALAILLLWSISAFNTFVRLENNIEGQWAQVENQLQRRNDLIPNLVKVVKGYAKHEKDLFTSIAESRARLAGAKTSEDKVRANNELTGALSRLLVIVEQYPTLQANKNFLALQDQLEGTENRIAVERQRYNELVKQYNISRRSFPINVIAMLFKFEAKKSYIDVPQSKQEVPNVDL